MKQNKKLPDAIFFDLRPKTATTKKNKIEFSVFFLLFDLKNTLKTNAFIGKCSLFFEQILCVTMKVKEKKKSLF